MTYIITEEQAVDVFPHSYFDASGKLVGGTYLIDDKDGLRARLPGGREVYLNVPICEECDHPVDATGFCKSCDDFNESEKVPA